VRRSDNLTNVHIPHFHSSPSFVSYNLYYAFSGAPRNMGASATDIITYIGVPLAVLGILPILYTCVKVLITLEKIKHELRRHGSTAAARSNLMSGIVEIELPRYSLQPLPREDQNTGSRMRCMRLR
jgi:hypothetical protein